MNKMANLIYPTIWRGRRFRVVNEEYMCQREESDEHHEKLLLLIYKLKEFAEAESSLSLGRRLGGLN